MILSAKFYKSLEWTIHTLRFCKNHFWPLFALGLVAGIGRAIQLKALGPISPASNILLEITVESTRILLFFYALGVTSVRTGIARFIQFMTNKQSRKQSWQFSRQTMRKNWLAVLVNFCAFAVIAFVLNAFIDHIAYETCLYITLKARQLIADQASEWVLILFFKNITVIPFTLIFQALFCLWLVDRLPKSIAYR